MDKLERLWGSLPLLIRITLSPLVVIGFPVFIALMMVASFSYLIFCLLMAIITGNSDWVDDGGVD